MERYSYEQDESYIKRLVEYIRELEEELKKYKHYYDYEKEELADSCYDFSRENDKLKEENRKLKDELTVVHRYENIELEVAGKRIEELEEENRKLKEERDFFKEQAILWRNDYKNEYEENRKLKSDLNLVIDERDNAFKKIKQLEERLDNKEKVNKQLREELGKMVMKS